jgi:hypothetical protein
VNETITIERRFRGPMESGNGGYTCGLLASAIEPDLVEVTLRLQPPLDTELELVHTDGGAELLNGEDVVAAGAPIDDLDVDVIDPVSIADAQEARRASPMHEYHPFSECFVCGPDRHAGDGLRETAGPVRGRDAVAAPFAPDPSLPNTDGRLHTEICWASLDCPGGIALMLLPDVGTSVLGRLAARVLAPIEVGATYAAVGWPLGRDSRKIDAGSALFDADGGLVAYARARWIELRA